jgi:hypothetical protein
MILKMSDYRLSDLFQVFFDAVAGHGGDGWGVILCEDPQQMSREFEGWWSRGSKSRERFFQRLVKDEREGSVNYHDSNENFMFSNDKSISEEPFLDCLIILEGTPKPE